MVTRSPSRAKKFLDSHRERSERKNFCDLGGGVTLIWGGGGKNLGGGGTVTSPKNIWGGGSPLTLPTENHFVELSIHSRHTHTHVCILPLCSSGRRVLQVCFG